MTAPQDDIDRIMAVMQAAFDPAYGEAWTRRQIEDALLLGNCFYRLAAAPGGEPAGFTLSRFAVDEEELLLIAVDPRWRGQGIASQLLTDMLDAAAARGARRVLLEMRESNPAERLYARLGFEPIGRRRNYYRTAKYGQIDAITFARQILSD